MESRVGPLPPGSEEDGCEAADQKRLQPIVPPVACHRQTRSGRHGSSGYSVSLASSGAAAISSQPPATKLAANTQANVATIRGVGPNRP